MRFTRRHPKSSAAAMTAITLVAGAAAVVLADFGAPAWAFGALLLWPVTAGLPSTLAVLLLASAWGRVPFAAGLAGFVGVSAVLAWAFQWAAVILWNRWRNAEEPTA